MLWVLHTKKVGVCCCYGYYILRRLVCAVVMGTTYLEGWCVLLLWVLHTKMVGMCCCYGYYILRRLVCAAVMGATY